jgi:hypothetical protein
MTSPATVVNTVRVSMSRQTAEALDAGRFNLYLLHSASCAEGGGLPLVWGRLTFFVENTALTWTEDWSVFGSTQRPPLNPLAQVVATDGCPARTGDAFKVGPEAMLAPDPGGGVPDVITLRNTTSTPFLAGLGLPPMTGPGSLAPICAFPLYGNNDLYPVPGFHVLLMLTTLQFDVGNPMTRMYGPTAAVDISRAAEANLDYDINRGWSGDSGSVIVVTPDQFLSLLISTPA